MEIAVPPGREEPAFTMLSQAPTHISISALGDLLGVEALVTIGAEDDEILNSFLTVDRVGAIVHV